MEELKNTTTKPNRLQNVAGHLQSMDLDALNRSVFEVSEMNRGGYNINYLATSETGDKFVYRLNLDNYLDVENQIQYEYNILKYLEPYNIAPKVFHTENSDQFGNIMLEEFFEGDLASEFADDINTYKNIGALLSKLHSLDKPDGIDLLEYKNPLHNQLEFINSKINFIKSGNFNPDFINFIEEFLPSVTSYVETNADKFPEEDTRIVHRDLVLENIMSTKDGFKLIDWQSAMIDDPSYDLAHFTNDLVAEWTIGRKYTDEEKNAFFESYTSKSLDKNILEKTQIRSPLVYLELFVWSAYRAACLKDRLQNNLIDGEDLELAIWKITAYENFLDQEKITRYLEVFH